MLEHIAEHYAFADAYPKELKVRSKHPHAMAIVDDYLAPLLFGRTDAKVDSIRLNNVLRALEEATATASPQPRLLAMHIGPVWLRFRLWYSTHAETRSIEARAVLCDWLEDAVQLDCLKRTAPDPITHQEDLPNARRAGLMP